jgi:hypothetical protein
MSKKLESLIILNIFSKLWSLEKTRKYVKDVKMEES